MKAVVDPDICIGCKICTEVCPGVFKMNGDKAVAYVEIVPKNLEVLAQDAADQCPVSAITIK